MKNNLSILRDGLEQFDNDYEKSNFFYYNPQERLKLITQLLEFSVVRIDGISNTVEVNKRMNEIMRWLDNNYHGYEWTAHEVHFHTNFSQFASCTFTCLNEISSLLEKLIKEKFAA